MTASETGMTAKLPARMAWPRGADMRRHIIARSAAWCEATGTKHTILALALTGNTAFLDRVPAGMIITIDMYDRCMTGLDALARLDAAAGRFVRPSRKGRAGGSPSAREAIRARVEDLGAAVGIPPQLIALAVTRDSTLLRARGGISDAQFRAYSARLDRIEAAL